MIDAKETARPNLVQAEFLFDLRRKTEIVRFFDRNGKLTAAAKLAEASALIYRHLLDQIRGLTNEEKRRELYAQLSCLEDIRSSIKRSAWLFAIDECSASGAALAPEIAVGASPKQFCRIEANAANGLVRRIKASTGVRILVFGPADLCAEDREAVVEIPL